MNYAIAVLDIGKTNKKIAVYDENLQPVTVRKHHIDTITHEELDVEDVGLIEEWFLDRFTELAREYPIRVIGIGTHGASVVCVDEGGQVCVPPVAYTNEVDESVHRDFYELAGHLSQLQPETGTAEVKPLVNVAKLLFFEQRRFPAEFARTRHILMYPQYFGYRLTGNVAADITSVGCHSFLWNPNRGDWSIVTDRLGIRDLLPEKPLDPVDILGTISPKVAVRTGLAPETIVTVGIHDSNSSLVPYLITRDEDFVLNSTGTWCVAMHPTDTFAFNPDEIGKTVFYNLSYCGQPVKTSIVMAGLEYETYTSLLRDRFGRNDDPGFDLELYGRIIRECGRFILPAVLKGGQFPDTDAQIVETTGATRRTLTSDILGGTDLPPALKDYREALALVNISVAIQSIVALRRVDLKSGATVFVEGGFRNNNAYLALLSALLPENPIALTDVEEATSLGAALCAKAALDRRPVEELRDTVTLNVQPLPPTTIPGLESYTERWLKLVEES